MEFCHVLSGTSLFSFLTKIGIINCLLGVWTKLWDFEQNYKKLWKTQKVCYFSQLPIDRKDSFLRKTDFIEMVCFLYWCFEKTKLEIQFYTELSDLQNQVIKIPIEIKHKNMYLFLRARVVSMIIWWCFTTLNLTAKM